MTITLLFPTSGRIGPGIPVGATWDLVGPHAANTTMELVLLQTSTGASYYRSEFFFPTNSFSERFGDQLRVVSGGIDSARADGTATTLRINVNTPGSGTVDQLDTTGFFFDPTSGLGYMIGNAALYMVANAGSSSSSTLAAILAAVKHTYSC